MEKYWISPSSSTWNSIFWSLSSGGSGGEPIPDSTDIVIFDSSGLGMCTLDTTVNIGGMRVEEGFTGIISQNGYELKVGPYDASFVGGIFRGNGADIRILGNLYIGSGSDFTSTDATLSCDKMLMIQF